MNMQRFLFILQVLLKCSMIFLIAFIWLRFLLSSSWISGIIAFSVTLFIELISLYLKKKNKNKTSLKLKEKEDAENMFLSLLTDKNYLNFFFELSKSRHSQTKVRKKYILIEHLDNTKIILYPFIKISSFKEDDILEICKLCQSDNPDKIVIICNEYEKKCESFIKNLSQNILILDKYETYSLLYKDYDFYPNITERYYKQSKLKIKDLIAYSFNKSRTKGYLFSALVLFSTSFFVKLNLYYCLVGTMLLFFALISFINPRYNINKEQTIL